MLEVTSKTICIQIWIWQDYEGASEAPVLRNRAVSLKRSAGQASFHFPSRGTLVPFDNEKHTVLTHWSNTQVSICPVWCDWLDEFNFKLISTLLFTTTVLEGSTTSSTLICSPPWLLTSEGGKRLKDQMTEKVNMNAHVGKHQAVADRWHLHGQNSREKYLRWRKIRGTSARMKQPTKAQMLYTADMT